MRPANSRIGLVFAACSFALLGASNGSRAEQPQRPLLIQSGAVETVNLNNLKAGTNDAFAPGRAYIIQIAEIPTTQSVAALQRAGVQLLDYLPENAYIANLDRADPAALANMDDVVFLGSFQREWKLSPTLGRRELLTPERREIARRGLTPIIITLFVDRPADAVIRSIQNLPEATIHWSALVGRQWTISATVRQADVTAPADLDEVQLIEDAPELSFRNSSTRWIVQSNVLNATPIWDHGVTGLGQIVGVMDGRVNRDHCSFRDAIDNTPGPAHRKIQAYNTTFGYDLHGTHVSGTAVGQDVDGSTGDTRGTAYDGRLVFSNIPSYTDAAMYSALSLAHSQGARVHTNSWGDDGTTNYNSLCVGIDRFSHDFEESLVVFAVTNTSILKNPENAKNCLAVGASNDTPTQTSACFGTSGRGPTSDGRRKPEVYAPGCGTVSSSGSGQSCAASGLTGTSMATPAVSGVALLARQYYMDGFYPTGAATPAHGFTPSGALLRATLINSSVDMTGISGYPSNKEGWGRLLADDALYFSGDARKLIVADDIRNASGLSTAELDETPFTVIGSGQQLRASLVYTDPPASASTGSALATINDLDLELVAPDGSLYLGNVFSGGVSIIGGTKDAKNTVEQVHVTAPQTGPWLARVRGAAVVSGLQGFALVITGDVSTMAPAPALSSISPDSANADLIVSTAYLFGTFFQTSGTTTVRLTKSGRPDIVATAVNVAGPGALTCQLDLNGAIIGAYDVVVTNPDGQAATLPAGFTIITSCLRGDVNGDTLVDAGDIARFVEIFVSGGDGGTAAQRCAGDLQITPNGMIDEPDVSSFADCLLAAGCS